MTDKETLVQNAVNAALAASPSLNAAMKAALENCGNDLEAAIDQVSDRIANDAALRSSIAHVAARAAITATLEVDRGGTA